MDDFVGIYADESQVKETIKNIFESCGYVIDPHTAVAAFADLENKKNDSTVSVVVSTASPYKFARNVLLAIDPSLISDDDLEMADALSGLSKVPVPKAVTTLRDAKIIHDTVVDINGMPDTVRDFVFG